MASTRRWHLSCPSDLEDVLSASLWALGCLGIETRSPTGSLPEDFEGQDRLFLEVFFPDPLPEAALQFDLAAWRQQGVERHQDVLVPAQDWLSSYREVARPFDVGRRFRIDPGEPPEDATQPTSPPPPDAEGRFLLRLPARTAFGTGSHESTRLTLRWIERLPLRGRRLLDVGTGSGILAFAALLLGASRVVGYDVDLETACIARQNMVLNGLAFDVVAGTAATLAEGPLFDVLLVNVLPERIAADLPRLCGMLRPGGDLISSGNLITQSDLLIQRFADLGLTLQDHLEDGEWTAFHFRSAAS